ncbi:MAG: hypothetical protein LBB43_03010 [Spirochaetaceae bacterium]|jgi:DNA transposition AAA+ family ATPase|nr:hypothetical protein [Spirochaetaceae bacterium]
MEIYLALEDKIRSFLKREERRVEVETTTVENIRKAVEMAHDNKDISVITGDAGTGKTTAIKQYVQESHAALALYGKICRRYKSLPRSHKC